MTVQTIGEQGDLNLILGIVVQAFKTVILALKTAVGLLVEAQIAFESIYLVNIGRLLLEHFVSFIWKGG